MFGFLGISATPVMNVICGRESIVFGNKTFTSHISLRLHLITQKHENISSIGVGSSTAVKTAKCVQVCA